MKVREYGEGLPVKIYIDRETGRPVIRALNEAGCNGTMVDLIDVIDWVRENYPELLEKNIH